MKPLLLIMAICFCILACKKEKPVSPALVGKWELIKSVGGPVSLDTTHKAGSVIYQFNGNGTYNYYLDGKLVNHGTFQIKSYPSSDNSYQEILFDNDTNGELISLNGNKLTIRTRAATGFLTEYEKIQN